MEVIWKADPRMINQRIIMETRYHKVHHVFRVGRGTDTTSLEANLFKHLMSMREEVLYYVFLNPSEVYYDMEVSGDSRYWGHMRPDRG